MNAPMRHTPRRPGWEKEDDLRESNRIAKIQQTSIECARQKPPVSLPTVLGVTYEFDVEADRLSVNGQLQDRLMKG